MAPSLSLCRGSVPLLGLQGQTAGSRPARCQEEENMAHGSGRIPSVPLSLNSLHCSQSWGAGRGHRGRDTMIPALRQCAFPLSPPELSLGNRDPEGAGGGESPRCWGGGPGSKEGKPRAQVKSGKGGVQRPLGSGGWRRITPDDMGRVSTAAMQ